LHYAADYGHKEIVELLIAKGADVNAKNGSGETPLDWAKVEIAELLRKHGGKRGEKLEVEGKPTDPVAEAAKPEPPTAKTPLWKAAMFGEIEPAKQAIADGADVNVKNKYGLTALHRAACEGHRDIVELLIANGEDVNVKKDDGMTPLHCAGVFGHKETAELLIAEGADVNAKDNDAITPLHHATEEFQKEIAELLIDNSADLNAKDDEGSTPLHHAVYEGHKETVELLIAKGADVNAKDEDGDTPLVYAEGEKADILRKHGAKAGDELNDELKAEGINFVASLSVIIILLFLL
jgi:ankyrin repeat protein